jgi:O-methyltransferase
MPAETLRRRSGSTERLVEQGRTVIQSPGQPVKNYKDIVLENPDDRAYVEILKKVSPYTMTGSDGLETTYALFQAVRYIVQNNIPGDMVECGVWRGGSMMLIAYALRHFGDTSRRLYLYDTYAGMTEPDDIDIDYDGRAMKPLWAQITGQKMQMGFGGSLEQVKANMQLTGYPDRRMHFVEGDVLQTVPGHSPSRIAVLRLDTDWYKSTLHELKHFYDLIVPHGVLIVDDYGWCRGARRATDEFFHDQPFKPMMHRVDQGPRIAIKPV